MVCILYCKGDIISQGSLQETYGTPGMNNFATSKCLGELRKVMHYPCLLTVKDGTNKATIPRPQK